MPEEEIQSLKKQTLKLFSENYLSLHMPFGLLKGYKGRDRMHLLFWNNQKLYYNIQLHIWLIFTRDLQTWLALPTELTFLLPLLIIFICLLVLAIFQSILRSRYSLNNTYNFGSLDHQQDNK